MRNIILFLYDGILTMTQSNQHEFVLNNVHHSICISSAVAYQQYPAPRNKTKTVHKSILCHSPHTLYNLKSLTVHQISPHTFPAPNQPSKWRWGNPWKEVKREWQKSWQSGKHVGRPLVVNKHAAILLYITEVSRLWSRVCRGEHTTQVHGWQINS